MEEQEFKIEQTKEFEYSPLRTIGSVALSSDAEVVATGEGEWLSSNKRPYRIALSEVDDLKNTLEIVENISRTSINSIWLSPDMSYALLRDICNKLQFWNLLDNSFCEVNQEGFKQKDIVDLAIDPDGTIAMACGPGSLFSDSQCSRFRVTPPETDSSRISLACKLWACSPKINREQTRGTASFLFHPDEDDAQQLFEKLKVETELRLEDDPNMQKPDDHPMSEQNLSMLVDRAPKRSKI